MADSGEMLDEVRSSVRRSGLCVYAERRRGGSPAGSTPLDFSLTIFTATSVTAVSAPRSAAASCRLPISWMGDQIEIITQKQPNPSRDWRTRSWAMSPPAAGARRSITGSGRIATKNILAGRQMLDNELEHLGISLKEAEEA